jgi:hypothetical protein
MPRELLLPIPHHIADKVHHLLTDEAEYYMDASLHGKSGEDRATGIARGQDFQALADKLDTLAREAGVLGW